MNIIEEKIKRKSVDFKKTPVYKQFVLKLTEVESLLDEDLTATRALRQKKVVDGDKL